jgi:hypothetical protein
MSGQLLQRFNRPIYPSSIMTGLGIKQGRNEGNKCPRFGFIYYLLFIISIFYFITVATVHVQRRAGSGFVVVYCSLDI